jgi:hypothetical protein
LFASSFGCRSLRRDCTPSPSVFLFDNLNETVCCNANDLAFFIIFLWDEFGLCAKTLRYRFFVCGSSFDIWCAILIAFETSGMI